MGIRHLDRLRRIQEIVAACKDVDASAAVLICASGAGFHDELVACAGHGDVELVDLHRLYQGA